MANGGLASSAPALKEDTSMARNGPSVSWSASAILQGLAEKVERDLRLAHDSIGHSSNLGEASQQVWIRIFDTYQPERYRAR